MPVKEIKGSAVRLTRIVVAMAINQAFRETAEKAEYL